MLVLSSNGAAVLGTVPAARHSAANVAASCLQLTYEAETDLLSVFLAYISYNICKWLPVDIMCVWVCYPGGIASSTVQGTTNCFLRRFCTQAVWECHMQSWWWCMQCTSIADGQLLSAAYPFSLQILVSLKFTTLVLQWNLFHEVTISLADD